MQHSEDTETLTLTGSDFEMVGLCFDCILLTAQF